MLREWVGQLVGLYGELTASARSLYTWTNRLNRRIRESEEEGTKCKFQKLDFKHQASLRRKKLLSDYLTSTLWPHLVSLMTSFSPWRRLSVVIENKSKTTPTSLLAIFCALSGWSPEIGNITMGTLWHSPSKRPCEPAWVMKARTPGCADTHRYRDVRWSRVRNIMAVFTGAAHGWFTHLISHSEVPIPLFSHSLGYCQESPQCTSILPLKRRSLFIAIVLIWNSSSCVCIYIPAPSVESV